MTGRRTPYVNLFTRMKSPTRRVGTMELEGILNGSTRNERRVNTMRMTGKKLTEYSTHQGCLASFALLFLRNDISRSHTRPVTASRRNRNSAKLNFRSAAGPRERLPAGFRP